MKTILVKKYKCLKSQAYFLDNYSLATIQPGDIEDIRSWRNGQLDVLRQKTLISQSQQKKYFSDMIWPSMNFIHPKNILFSFFYKGKRIGYGGLVHISWLKKTAEMSFLLDTKYLVNDSKYKTYFKIYIDLILFVAFKCFKFDKVITETYSFRKNHINILEKSGFIVKKIIKNNLIINEKYFDSIFHEMFNDKKNA